MEDGAHSAGAESRLSVAFDWHRFRPEQDINRQCERYNGLCSVLHKAKNLHVADETRSNAVKQDVLELEQILKDAKDAINSKLQDLENDIQLFSSELAAHADPRWYRNVEDLTACEDTVFMHIVKTMSIVDTPDFANYLMEALPRAVKNSAPKYEFRSGRSFLSKAMILVRKFLQSCEDDYSVALPVVLTMKIRVFPGRSSRNPRKIDTHDIKYKEVERMIKTLLRNYDMRIREDPDLFWNLAADFRETINYEWQNRRPGMACMGLIDALRDRAEVEIRRRTMLAINGRLPTELAVLLEDFALLAEEVPQW